MFIYANTSWYLYNFRGNLIKELLLAGHKVVAVAPQDDYSTRLEALGCEFFPIEMDNMGKSPIVEMLLIWRIRKLLKQFKPQIAFTFTIKCNIYTCLAAMGLPISVNPNVSGLGTAFLSNGFLNKIVRTLYSVAFKKADIIFFQNTYDEDLFRKLNFAAPNQIQLLPGSGVDLSHFSAVKLPNNQQVTFLMLARLLWDKGVGEYVEAIKTVKQEFPNTRFQLLGFLDVDNHSAVHKDSVDEWVNQGILEYLGSTDDVRQFIKNADCVVLPSYSEGTPRSLLESAAMARPIITTDIPGCRNVVNDGITGYFCKPRDAQDLANKMKLIVSIGQQERVEMGKSGRKMIEEKYDEKIVLAAYLKLV